MPRALDPVLAELLRIVAALAELEGYEAERDALAGLIASGR